MGSEMCIRDRVEGVREADGYAVPVLDALLAEASGYAGGSVPDCWLVIGEVVEFFDGFGMRGGVDGGAQHGDEGIGAVGVAGYAG